MPSTDIIVDLCEPDGNRPSIDELNDRWSDTSRARLGLSRQQWHHPVNARLVAALGTGEDLTAVLAQLGEARATAGLSLEEALADLEVLHRLRPAARTRSNGGLDGITHLDSLVAAACVGSAWAEMFYATTESPTCVDPITGLVTGAFLEARIQEVYRHSEHLGLPAERAHVLVVLHIKCASPSPFARIARRLRRAGDLRAAFPGGNTVALLEPTHTMVALTDNGPELADALAALKASGPDDLVWVEPLPGSSSEAIALVRELATTPRLPGH